MVTAETGRRFRSTPAKCPMRIMAEVVFEVIPTKTRVEVDAHPCKGTPKCPRVFERPS